MSNIIRNNNAELGEFIKETVATNAENLEEVSVVTVPEDTSAADPDYLDERDRIIRTGGQGSKKDPATKWPHDGD